MKISRLFNSVRKRLAAGAIVALAVILPVAATAAETVQIEADTTVANASSVNPTWGTSATATYNEVVDVQVVYNNKEAADSGKIASNLRVKVTIPTAAGATQTIATKTSADNSNTVNGTATVNLGRADAHLEYIPGTATWKHATAANSALTATQKVSDDVVTNPNGLVLENENPCQAGSIQVQARVVVPGVQVTKQVRLKGDHTWAANITAKAGDTVQYMISYTNNGNADEKSVVIGDKLPTGVTYVAGTSYLANDTAPNGKSVADGVTTTGIIVGDYAPTANAFVMFDAKLPAEDKLQCGENKLTNTASAQPQGMGVYTATADVTLSKTCDTTKTPVYSCDALTFTQGDNRSVTAKVTYTAKDGATFQNATIDWGDSSADPTGDNNSATHSYDKDGTYNMAAAVNFTVDGGNKTASSAGCAKSVTFKTVTPETPVYTCDMVSVTQGTNRTVNATVTYTAKNGAAFKTATFDWGDGSTPLTTTNTTAGYQYAKDGTYMVTAKLLFSVEGVDKFADSQSCAKQVSYNTPTPPVTPPKTPELPNTGAGNVVGWFAAAVLLGGFGYRLFLSRKLTR
jgi:uncharacterized repeat protein (TIGR01451 family)